jgi:hypothetical protein
VGAGKLDRSKTTLNGDPRPVPDEKDKSGSATRPNVPSGIGEYFLPVNLTPEESAEQQGLSGEFEFRELDIVYKPVLLASAQVRFLKRNYNLDHDLVTSALVDDIDPRGRVDWEEWLVEDFDSDDLDRKARGEARFLSLDSPLSDGSSIRDLETDFKDWIYHEVSVTVRAQEELDIYVGPEVSQGDFRELCAEKTREMIDEKQEKIEESFAKKMKTIQDRILREERELAEDEAEFSQRRLEELGTHAENVLSLLAGRKRRMTTSLTKRRMTSKAKADIKESLDTIEQYQKEIEGLEEERKRELQEVETEWKEKLNEITEIPVTPYKKDIMIDVFGVAWMPLYSGEQEGRRLEIRAYSA